MNPLFPDPFLHSTLNAMQIAEAIDQLVGGEASEKEKGEFLTALDQRGVTAQELAHFAKTLLSRSIDPQIKRDHTSILELCGTGGDASGLLNISTAAMFVVAGAGAHVVKHGDRAITSRCGSADVLQELGVSIFLDPTRVNEVLDCAGCVFLLASHFHPILATVAPLRRSLATRGQLTIFNLLGPLLNPAQPGFQLTGIYSPKLLSLYAEAMGLLGRKRAWAVHGEGLEGSLDELSITGQSRVVSVSQTNTGLKFEKFMIIPEQLGLGRWDDANMLRGADAPMNAKRIEAILANLEKGVAKEMIILNAGAALYLAELESTFLNSILRAREALESGAALRSLIALRRISSDPRMMRNG